MISYRLKTCRLLYQALGISGTARVITAKLRGSTRVYVQPKNSSYPILVRMNNSDLPTVSEVFCSAECEVSLSWRPRTVLDLGANIGLTALKLKRQFPEALLIAVEADIDSARVCRENLAHLPHTVVLQKAIGWGGATVKCVNPTAPSISRRFETCNANDLDAVDEITVRDILDHYQCRPPILVKMDIEGAEAPCFEHRESWLPAVNGVLVEPHSRSIANNIKESLLQSRFRVSYVGEKIFGDRVA
jgi:FkbM family methyltransferase